VRTSTRSLHELQDQKLWPQTGNGRGRTTVQIAELVGMKTEGVQCLFRRWKGLELNGDARRQAGRFDCYLGYLKP
jgi:hypothetical protein